MTDLPATLIDAVRFFSDLETCNDLMRTIKWPSGKITCPKCGGDAVSQIASRPGMHTCNKRECRQQFSCKVGTIFEDSPLPLGHWFTAIWSIANCRNGISSHELGRALGVTQRTAWFMLHRIRLAMECGSFDTLATADSWACNRSTTVSKKPKPQGWRKFVDLTKRIAKVPKAELDAKLAERKRKRQKK